MGEIRMMENQSHSVSVQDANQILRVAAYCRVSTVQEEQADSYETQCEYYRRLIDADPKLTLVDVYGDHGLSGLSTTRRPEFLRMMKDCMDGKVDLIMTKSISRFARNLADCVDCVRALKEKGIPVSFEQEGVDSMDSGCEFILSVLATLAQEEVNNLSQNIRWSLEHRNASGNPARKARYGYRRVMDEKGKKGWEIDEPEAERVRLAFRLAAKGESYQRMIAALNSMEMRKGSAVRWTQLRVREMLKSETYIGDILTNKAFKPDYLSPRVVKNTGQRTQYYVEGHHEPIVDRETFEKVGALIRQNVLSAATKWRRAK
ncbi:MAG: recombinase family protein [Eubacteriales bacterium]|nr:recombinase family protein [Eubacteriales bacterium]